MERVHLEPWVEIKISSGFLYKKTAQEILGPGWRWFGIQKGYYFLRVPKVILTAAPRTAGFWPVPEISSKG